MNVELREKSFQRTKRLILATPGLGRLAAWQKARRLERRYAQTVRGYSAATLVTKDAGVLLSSRGGVRLARLRSRRTPIRILYVGTDYMQDSSGILQALQRLGSVVAFTKEDGTYGQATSKGQMSFGLSESNGRRLIELVAGAAKRDEAFDLLIGQMWDGYMPCGVLQRVKEDHGCIVVNIAMDDRHTFQPERKHGRTFSTKGLIPGIDLAATAAPEAVHWYLAEGCPAVFFPEASDAELFHPMPELGKAHEVTFVGMNYGIRAQLVEALRRTDISVTTYGSGWPNGRIDTEEVPHLFAQSKLILGVGGVGQSRTLCAFKLRDFDGPMSGSCYLTQDNPDLHRVFRVGEEIVVYSTTQELVNKASSLLLDDRFREAIAAMGRARCAAEHTWNHRFRSLLDFLRGESANHPFRGESPLEPIRIGYDATH